MDWVEVKRGESQIGYSWVKPGSIWDASIAMSKQPAKKNIDKTAVDELKLETGNLSLDRLNMILTNLPLDISYVDENDKVRYYSNNKNRIFPRSPGVIGREVQNCHPHKSVDVVNRILESFKKREKKEAHFWIEMNGKTILINYIALYDNKGKYIGVVEVSQDITEIKKITGEKRLLDW